MIKNKKVQFKMNKYQGLHLGFKNKIHELEKNLYKTVKKALEISVNYKLELLSEFL